MSRRRQQRRVDVTTTPVARQDGRRLLAVDVGAASVATFEDHHTRHENGGADEIDVDGLSGLLADPQTPLEHGNEAHNPDFATAAALAAHLADTANPHATTAAQVGAPPTSRQIISGAGLTGGGDLSADRTLAVGAGVGITVGADSIAVDQTALKLDDFAAPDDNADLNVSTTTHGLAPKLPNDATKYLDGTGAYTVPVGSGSGFFTEETTTSTGTVNDFDLNARLTYLRCNNATALVLTGFSVAGGAPQAGDRVIVENIGTSTVRVAHQDTGSTEAYRCIGVSTRGQILGAGGRLEGVYDDTTDRWRITCLDPGAPITVAHSGGDFTASGGMTWTVESADLLTFTYQQRGKALKVAVVIENSSTSVAAGGQLVVAIPGGFVTTRTMFFPTYLKDDAAGFDTGACSPAAAGTTIRCFTRTLANWDGTSTNNTNLYFTIEFEID